MKDLFGKVLFLRNYSIFIPAFSIILFTGLAAACQGGSGNGAAENVSNAGGGRSANSNAVSATNPAAHPAVTNTGAVNSSTATVTSASNVNSSAAESDSANEITDPEMPTDVEVQTLVKTTLLDFNSALQSGSFDSFHSSASAYFQQQFTPAQLEQRFADLIKRKADLSIISDKQAIVTPRLENQNGIKVLIANGSYPTTPVVNFELQYLQEDIEWKLLSIEVNLK